MRRCLSLPVLSELIPPVQAEEEKACFSPEMTHPELLTEICAEIQNVNQCTLLEKKICRTKLCRLEAQLVYIVLLASRLERAVLGSEVC